VSSYSPQKIEKIMIKTPTYKKLLYLVILNSVFNLIEGINVYAAVETQDPLKEKSQGITGHLFDHDVLEDSEKNPFKPEGTSEIKQIDQPSQSIFTSIGTRQRLPAFLPHLKYSTGYAIQKPETDVNHFVWITDPHLNFLEASERINFYKKISRTGCQAVLISGDIAEAPSVVEILSQMAHHLSIPIYFVLGNHDYWRGSVLQVRNEMAKLTRSSPFLNWLPAMTPQNIMEDLAILGSDGWADGRFGDYKNSNFQMNDNNFIEELMMAKAVGKNALLKEMQRLADNDALQLREDIRKALLDPKIRRIIILTHVPPFKGSCLYKGKRTDKDALPYFCSQSTGTVLLEAAKNNPDIDFVILCGHTHNDASYKPLDNLSVWTGNARYSHPTIQKMIIL
jgi:predicted phosphohydrolase